MDVQSGVTQFDKLMAKYNSEKWLTREMSTKSPFAAVVITQLSCYSEPTV